MFPRRNEGEELEYPFFEGDGSSSDEWRDYGMTGDDYEGPPIFDDDQYEEESMPVYDADIEDSGFEVFSAFREVFPRLAKNRHSVPKKVQDFVEGLHEVHKAVRDNLVRVNSKYKKDADQKRRQGEFVYPGENDAGPSIEERAILFLEARDRVKKGLLFKRFMMLRLEFGREDFYLITGFRFGKVSLDPKEEDHSEFRKRVFPKNANLKGEHLLKLVKNDVEFNQLDDEDVWIPKLKHFAPGIPIVIVGTMVSYSGKACYNLTDLISHIQQKTSSEAEKYMANRVCKALRTGKTTSILALANELLGPNYKEAFLELNASGDRGIDVVRN
ncbi:hypothetical protein Tco_0776978 [Tanacetum coccineum]